MHTHCYAGSWIAVGRGGSKKGREGRARERGSSCCSKLCALPHTPPPSFLARGPSSPSHVRLLRTHTHTQPAFSLRVVGGASALGAAPTAQSRPRSPEPAAPSRGGSGGPPAHAPASARRASHRGPLCAPRSRPCGPGLAAGTRGGARAPSLGGGGPVDRACSLAAWPALPSPPTALAPPRVEFWHVRAHWRSQSADRAGTATARECRHRPDTPSLPHTHSSSIPPPPLLPAPTPPHTQWVASSVASARARAASSSRTTRTARARPRTARSTTRSGRATSAAWSPTSSTTPDVARPWPRCVLGRESGGAKWGSRGARMWKSRTRDRATAALATPLETNTHPPSSHPHLPTNTHPRSSSTTPSATRRPRSCSSPRKACTPASLCTAAAARR